MDTCVEKPIKASAIRLCQHIDFPPEDFRSSYKEPLHCLHLYQILHLSSPKMIPFASRLRDVGGRWPSLGRAFASGHRGFERRASNYGENWDRWRCRFTRQMNHSRALNSLHFWPVKESLERAGKENSAPSLAMDLTYGPQRRKQNNCPIYHPIRLPNPLQICLFKRKISLKRRERKKTLFGIYSGILNYKRYSHWQN